MDNPNRHTPDPDALLTIPDVAAFYQVTDHTVRAWLSRGDARLPQPIRLGRLVRFRRGDVLALLDALRVAGGKGVRQ
jgi:predicted DNA-binding transcriptional regulator AlpA